MKYKYIKRNEVKKKLSYICRSRGISLQTKADMFRAIDSLPYTVEAELENTIGSDWISCEERMPEPDTLVIVACYGSDIIIPQDGETLAESIERVQREHVTVTLGFIGSDGWYGCDYFPMMITPTYWQPLPEPPKGE